MRYSWILFLTSSLYAAQPIMNDYSNPQNLWDEFRNVYDSVQDKSFTQVTSTPALSEMKDGEIVIYNSTQAPTLNDIHLILRAGTTLYYTPNFKLMPGR